MFDQNTCRTYGCFCHQEWTHLPGWPTFQECDGRSTSTCRVGGLGSNAMRRMRPSQCSLVPRGKAPPGHQRWYEWFATSWSQQGQCLSLTGKLLFSPMKWWILLGNKGSFNAFNFWNFNQFRKLSSSTYHVKSCKEIYINTKLDVLLRPFQPNPMMLATLQVYTGSVPSWGKNSVWNQYGLSTKGQSSCEFYALSSHRTMWC